MNQEQAINDILEIVGFLKDNMVTRTEFESRLDSMVSKVELRQVLFEMESRLLTHIDGFIVLHQKLDTELTALRGKYERLEGFVKQLAAHANVTLDY